MADPIRAAGAVVLRPAQRQEAADTGELEVLVVHRPYREDWSLPKGKVEADEEVHCTAVREVAEETGVQITLGQPLPDVEYQVPTKKGMRDKVVHWWLGTAIGAEPRTADQEVDLVRWVSLPEADRLLTYDDERQLVQVAAARPKTTVLLVLRHGQARSRDSWQGDDEARPLTDKGDAQATALGELLPIWGPRRIISSPAWRCVATVLAYSSQAQLTIERQTMLTESHGAAHPQQVRQACAEWTRQIAASGTPTMVCGHRPVLPLMLDGFGLPEQSFATAEFVVAHVRSDLGIEALEQLRPRWVL